MYRIRILWQGEEMDTLKPILAPGLDILFIGLNPSPPSLAAGHYHQGRLGRRFWRRLKEYGLLDGALEGREDEALLANGFGIADIVPRPTARGADLTPEEFRLGAQFLRYLIRSEKPAIVCFIYKKVLEELTGQRFPKEEGRIRRRTREWKELFGDSQVFLFPSPYAARETERKIMAGLKRLLTEVRRKKGKE